MESISPLLKTKQSMALRKLPLAIINKEIANIKQLTIGQ